MLAPGDQRDAVFGVMVGREIFQIPVVGSDDERFASPVESGYEGPDQPVQPGHQFHALAESPAVGIQVGLEIFVEDEIELPGNTVDDFGCLLGRIYGQA